MRYKNEKEEEQKKELTKNLKGERTKRKKLNLYNKKH